MGKPSGAPCYQHDSYDPKCSDCYHTQPVPDSKEVEWPTMGVAEFSTPDDAKLARKLASEIQNMWRIESERQGDKIDEQALQIAAHEKRIAKADELIAALLIHRKSGSKMTARRAFSLVEEYEALRRSAR